MNMYYDHFTSKMKSGLTYPFKCGSSIMPFLKILKFLFFEACLNFSTLLVELIE